MDDISLDPEGYLIELFDKPYKVKKLTSNTVPFGGRFPEDIYGGKKTFYVTDEDPGILIRFTESDYADDEGVQPFVKDWDGFSEKTNSDPIEHYLSFAYKGNVYRGYNSESSKSYGRILATVKEALKMYIKEKDPHSIVISGSDKKLHAAYRKMVERDRSLPYKNMGKGAFIKLVRRDLIKFYKNDTNEEREILGEVFDAPYEYELIGDHGPRGSFRIEFGGMEDGDLKNYGLVTFAPLKLTSIQNPEVKLDTMELWFTVDHQVRKTGKGKGIKHRVFSTVVAASKDYVKKYKPNIISISVDTRDRDSSLYLKMLKRLAKSVSGYKYLHKAEALEDGSEDLILIYRNSESDRVEDFHQVTGRSGIDAVFESKSINEVFDDPYEFEFRPWLSGTDHAVFNAGGDSARVIFQDRKLENKFEEMRAIEISFDVSDQGVRRFSKTSRGGGREYRIFATVLEATRQYVKKNKPGIIFFTVDRADRNTSLYVRMIKKMAKKLSRYEHYVADNLIERGQDVVFVYTPEKSDEVGDFIEAGHEYGVVYEEPQAINEVFDKPYRYKTRDRKLGKYGILSVSKFDAIDDDGEGEQITVQIAKADSDLNFTADVNFFVKSFGTSLVYPMASGFGNTGRVFATLMKIVTDFIKKHEDILFIEFVAANDRLDEFYRRFMKALSKKTGLKYFYDGSTYVVDLNEGSEPKSLDEVFDRPYKYKEVDSGRKWVTHQFEFKTDDGSLIKLQAVWDKIEESMNVTFYRDGRFDVTGEGDQHKIFSTVVQIILKEIMPYYGKVSFSAGVENVAKDGLLSKYKPGEREDSRTRLYDKMVNRLARKYGYDWEKDQYGKITDYFITNPNPISR